ncbi:MAG: TSUP family transporter [Myxococcales bacterium]|nr:TSUP family transporter [Myxococcales bacterium]MCB9717969.1 TSUP family transporter [Myxococcales bacterium]
MIPIHDAAALGIVALVVTLGAAVQSAIGFGMGMVVVPLLLWSGRSLPEAVALLLAASLVQTAYGTWTVRAEVPWRTTLPVAAAQWAFVPLGVAGMVMLSEARPGVVDQAVGGIVGGVLVLRAVFRPRPRPQLARGWGLLAGAGAGFLAGLVGMGGPPIVLYALAHAWSKDRFRGFLWSSFLLVLPAATAVLVWRQGAELLRWSLLGLLLTPCPWLGSMAGLAVSRRWAVERVRLVAMGTLALIVAWSVLGPIVRG